MKHLILIAAALLIPCAAQAATLVVMPQPADPALYVVSLEAQDSINVAEVRLVVPPGTEVGPLSDAYSAAGYWVDAPRFDAVTGTLYFSALWPGGWQGHGELLRFRAPPGTAIQLDASGSHIYRNDGQGSEEKLSATLPAVAGSVVPWSARPPAAPMAAFFALAGLCLVAYFIVRLTHHEPHFQP